MSLTFMSRFCHAFVTGAEGGAAGGAFAGGGGAGRPGAGAGVRRHRGRLPGHGVRGGGGVDGPEQPAGDGGLSEGRAALQ
eukprot:5526914-Pyramimonas_sp.AAC.1